MSVEAQISAESLLKIYSLYELFALALLLSENIIYF